VIKLVGTGPRGSRPLSFGEARGAMTSLLRGGRGLAALEALVGA